MYLNINDFTKDSCKTFRHLLVTSQSQNYKTVTYNNHLKTKVVLLAM